MSLLAIAFLLIVVWVMPNMFRYLILAPFIGFCVGSFVWCILALLIPAIVSFVSYLITVAIWIALSVLVVNKIL